MADETTTASAPEKAKQAVETATSAAADVAKNTGEVATEKANEAREATQQKLEDASQNAQSLAKEKAGGFVGTVKKDVSQVKTTIKGLPKENKIKLFIGVTLIISVLIAFFSYGIPYIIFGVFIPAAVGTIMILSAYSQKDFVHEIAKGKDTSPKAGNVVIKEVSEVKLDDL